MFDPTRSGLFIWFSQSVWNRGFPKFCPCYLGQKIVRQFYLLTITEDFLWATIQKKIQVHTFSFYKDIL
jgi:hypothetical protein